MLPGNSTGRKAQLDKAEREQLEDIIVDLRDTVEDEIEYELKHQYGLTEKEGGEELSDEEQATRERLVEAIEHENPGDRSWEWCYEQYVNGVGYTLINRITALRCMEVRGFVDQPVTQIGDSDLTPAAEQVVMENPLLDSRDESLVLAYENKCERLSDEVELLFDPDSPYDVLDPEPDTFRDAIAKLDAIPVEVWRADDVLGWVYEYYNVALLDDLRRKGDRDGLEPEDVPPANQFYTPHWVVRMLTDNSLGKLYLEDKGTLSNAVEEQESLTPDERKNRPLSPDESPDIADFCTYLVPSEEEGKPPAFDGPKDLRVIDPACGSGHFLLYAFDVLERIYRDRTDIGPAEIPREILRNNLYGVDLDMRACQLAAFNLYLKGRTRAEAEGANGFDMPDVGIVCADAKVADIEGVEEVFDEVSDGRSEVEDALRRILDAFEEVHGLGSLLDVRGTLSDLFEDDSGQEGVQITLSDDPQEDHTLGDILHSLREAVDEHRDSDSFLAQDLRSFVRLLDVLAQDYDVTLMNPPYGSRNRMPDMVKKYVQDHYEYKPEFYINFFEVCDNLVNKEGRIGMLIPRTFMFKTSFEEFREDFIGGKGNFEFLAEFGIGVLDNATVRTVGTVVRSGSSVDKSRDGTFIRLHDTPSEKKEETFIQSAFQSNIDGNGVTRRYTREMSEFAIIPGAPLSYWVPRKIREIYSADTVFDEGNARVGADSLGLVNQGIASGNNDRFVRQFWETPNEDWVPFAMGGKDAWVLPKLNETLIWGDEGQEVKRCEAGNGTPNEDYYFTEGLTYTYIKEGGRRFGYLHEKSVFSNTGFVFLPKHSRWHLLSFTNSSLLTYLMIAQTTGRHWNAGEVSKLPWSEDVGGEETLAEEARTMLGIMLERRKAMPDSPHYEAPGLLQVLEEHSPESIFDHPHTSLREDVSQFEIEAKVSISDSTEEMGVALAKKRGEIQAALETKSREIDEAVFGLFNIGKDEQEEILREIALRTNEDPRNRDIPDIDKIQETPENFIEDVKDLVHHFAMEAVREESDGIIPLEGTNEQADMLDRIVERFEEAYGEYAEDRLVEVDDILGVEPAADEAYPNLRSFIEDDLFAYHVETMENAPIIWKLSTARLLADAKGEGFTCFIDYHQLDAGFFDRLNTRYIEPRAEQLRERRSAADRRRSDEDLPPEERAEAKEEFERYSSELHQIANFENVLQELGSVSKRALDDDARKRCEELAPKVEVFRQETGERIETLAKLRDKLGADEFQETFSDKFWENVDEWRDEWINALEELEGACRAYGGPTDEPVEAHLADLFDYFDWRLKGSDHHSSSGILFMTYYFEREGTQLLNDDGEPHDGLTDEAQLLASLATGLEDDSVLNMDYIDEVWEPDDDVPEDVEAPPLAEYKALAEEINDDCNNISKEIPSDWSDRALSEITNAGYQPNHKHGVAINITPFAEHDIVPEIVEDKVL